MSLILDFGWYGFGVASGPIRSVSLGVIRIGISIPALDKLLAREAAAKRAEAR